MRSIILLLLLFSIAACQPKEKSNTKANKGISNSIQKDSSILRKCILEKDTFLSSNTFIKYVIIDSFYTLRIGLAGVDTLLTYKFDCSTPRVLVPSLSSYYTNIICLVSGSGQDYRHYLICYGDGNKIILNSYDGALTTDLKNNFVVYQDQDSLQLVIVENFKVKTRKIFRVPAKYLTSSISRAVIEKNKLFIRFIDNRTYVFSNVIN